eukprot:850766-Pyramimonas_sp.AAC.1
MASSHSARASTSSSPAARTCAPPHVWRATLRLDPTASRAAHGFSRMAAWTCLQTCCSTWRAAVRSPAT